MTNIKLKKKKLKNQTYSLFIAVLIALVSFLLYIHDFDYFKGKKGFSGFSSLRLGIWVVSVFVFGISGWILAFIRSKGRKDRFSILAPIFMGLYQLFVYILDKRDSVINDLSFKVIGNFLVLFVIILFYFYLKGKESIDE